MKRWAWWVVGVLVALCALPVTWFVLSALSTPVGLTTELVRALDRDARAEPGDAERALKSSFAYAALVTRVQQARRAVGATEALLRDDKEFAKREEIAASKKRIDASWAKMKQALGVGSDEEWAEFLLLADQRTAETADREDLTSDQRAAALAAAARVLLSVGRDRDALRVSEAALAMSPSGMAARLAGIEAALNLGADATARRLIQAGQGRVAAWQSSSSQWDVRLLGAISRPTLRSLDAGDLAARRREIGSDLARVLRERASLLRETSERLPSS